MPVVEEEGRGGEGHAQVRVCWSCGGGAAWCLWMRNGDGLGSNPIYGLGCCARLLDTSALPGRRCQAYGATCRRALRRSSVEGSGAESTRVQPHFASTYARLHRPNERCIASEGRTSYERAENQSAS